MDREFKISEDGKQVIVTNAQALPAVYTMDLAAVEQQIATLGTVRANMHPTVAIEPPSDDRSISHVYRDPRIYLGTDALVGDVLIRVRDERYGWLTYIVSKDDARRLGQGLIDQADRPAPEMGGKA